MLQLIENERKKVTALPSSEDKEVALKALDIAGSKLGTVGPQLSLEDFSIVGVIARGSFGVVWQVGSEIIFNTTNKSQICPIK